MQVLSAVIHPLHIYLLDPYSCYDVCHGKFIPEGCTNSHSLTSYGEINGLMVLRLSIARVNTSVFSVLKCKSWYFL
jgi:hypothetical protein